MLEETMKQSVEGNILQKIMNQLFLSSFTKKVDLLSLVLAVHLAGFKCMLTVTWKWRCLRSLQHLTLCDLPKMIRLPEEMLFATSLHELRIEDCLSLSRFAA